jgi:transcriptional regulator GlxA family with amidase domain
MIPFSIFLFDDFETLDAFGPAEVIGVLADFYTLQYFSAKGGVVTSAHGLRIETRPADEIPPHGVLLIPGGMGTRTLVSDEAFITRIKEKSLESSFTLTVCTGSALLARTGLLDNRPATSNKNAFEWVKRQGALVQWVSHARWVADGDIYTSSGISAGIDMTLAFVRDQLGYEIAASAAKRMEYVWHEDWRADPFALNDNN